MVYLVCIDTFGGREVLCASDCKENAIEFADAYNKSGNKFGKIVVEEVPDFIPPAFDKWDNIIFSCSVCLDDDMHPKVMCYEHSLSVRDMYDVVNLACYRDMVACFAIDGNVYVRDIGSEFCPRQWNVYILTDNHYGEAFSCGEIEELCNTAVATVRALVDVG